MQVSKTIRWQTYFRRASCICALALSCFSVLGQASIKTDSQTAGEDPSIINPVATGEGLFSYCRSQPAEPISAIGFGVCLGFIEGIVERDAMLPKDQRQICPSDGTQWGDEYEVVVNFLRDHPKNRQMPARVLALSALSEAFPCVA
ncbi:hypothetical protein KRR38_30695 [Novosphingobium sp. G106]|uniref:Rap1a/Tai family immunity protein n=1 Tax=Novosphingobium sp. G106 TaxID=2849500 RepID=UPI001C2D7399|nr:Rap1a/Tai family immunity protein [Novosphingobium sp. G106]MBV1691917.1 hypothetical protein [Novosphingobium sp. G106]